MSAIVINHKATEFELELKKAAVWFSRIEQSLYAVVFMLVLGAIYLDYDSRLEVKIVIMAIVGLVFMVLFIKKIKAWKDYKFSLKKIGDGFIINEKTKADTILISDIFMSEMISTYSANRHFDIYLRINGKKFVVIECVTEKDKETIMRELKVFISNFFTY